ncbi:hypothetical protein FGIG_02863 [Fasciola gigantica]|uniref:Uncharacterized protein n=2 Tax=Fasciola TaxID=6191 RepID=A0A4E0S024_FASHE|nr:hypothetical protein D915_003758 [Fasciola hepatica]TPP61961.1 hypothetical protein FGIG_02863 [Fasciola gigantica]
MGLMGSIFGTIGAIFFIGVIGFLIYRFCIYRRRKELQATSHPVAPMNPAMGDQHYPGSAPYPTGPTGYPVGPGGGAQPPYPTTNVAPQPGAGWTAPGSGWGDQTSPPPPYPGS